MKRILIRLLSGILVLTACQGAPATESITPPSPLVMLTTAPATPTPSPTLLPPTQTITPLPTIPTFTPTLDVSTIVTATPAPPPRCPKEDPNIAASFTGPYLYGYGEILTYLNAGGPLSKLAPQLPAPQSDSSWDGIADLTGDGLNEVVFSGLVRYDILGCKNGIYQDLFSFEWDGAFDNDVAGVLDLNQNRIPEIGFYRISRYGYAEVYIYEWDGNKFRSLIQAGEADSVLATSPFKITDTNGDGLKEIVIEYNVNELCYGLGGLNFCNGTPARVQTTILGWNGQNYVALNQKAYPPPQYRFQAIQDGDWQARSGNYAGAFSLYQEAISNDQLEWWSPKREVYEIHTFASQFDATPTIYPTPVLDNTEYPRLAAYAYYRIMLLHIVQGHGSDAATVYQTLQQKFGSDPYGQPYVEMATVFWNVYQSTHKMYAGCAAAIAYAAEHPEILVPLGSDYHGDQSHTYVPADVCPFR